MIIELHVAKNVFIYEKKMKFKEFVEEFGFTDPVEAWETWNSCKQAHKKLSRIYNGDFYDLINFLND